VVTGKTEQGQYRVNFPEYREDSVVTRDKLKLVEAGAALSTAAGSGVGAKKAPPPPPPPPKPKAGAGAGTSAETSSGMCCERCPAVLICAIVFVLQLLRNPVLPLALLELRLSLPSLRVIRSTLGQLLTPLTTGPAARFLLARLRLQQSGHTTMWSKLCLRKWAAFMEVERVRAAGCRLP
jgi:hypothetical protein